MLHHSGTIWPALGTSRARLPRASATSNLESSFDTNSCYLSPGSITEKSQGQARYKKLLVNGLPYYLALMCAYTRKSTTQNNVDVRDILALLRHVNQHVVRWLGGQWYPQHTRVQVLMLAFIHEFISGYPVIRVQWKETFPSITRRLW